MNHLALMLNKKLSAEELDRLLEDDLNREARLLDEIRDEAIRLKAEHGPGPAAKMLLSMADIHFLFGYSVAGTFAACAAGALDAVAQKEKT